MAEKYDYKNYKSLEDEALDNKKIAKWLKANYKITDNRALSEKVRYYLKKRNRRLSAFGKSFPEQILYLIYYKIWKHFNKKLCQKGILNEKSQSIRVDAGL